MGAMLCDLCGQARVSSAALEQKLQVQHQAMCSQCIYIFLAWFSEKIEIACNSL